MVSRGALHLRKTTNTVLDALIQATEDGRPPLPGINALHDIVATLKTSAAFDDFYSRAYREMMEIVATEEQVQKRVNVFGRLLIHPMSDLFKTGVFDRDILPNVFSFLHLVLGDECDAFGAQCTAIVAALREEQGDNFTWDAFYDDGEAKKILWRTLVRIAALFKRWDVRKEWFIKLMQYTPSTVSMGQSAFVVKDNHGGGEREPAEPRVFTERHFCQFFQAMFRPLTEIKAADGEVFRREFGADPHHLIGDFLMHLASCAV
jgi:hypothetical protein